ncbi:hypothetical protein G6L57_26380 [Agrobacterium tumefaciens]|nr:hypothetical protein [Agrobacterium tumefaciens]
MEATYSAEEGGRVILRNGTALPSGNPIPLPSGANLMVGVRPENVLLTPQAGLEVDVKLVEPTGLGFILHLRLHEVPFKIFTRDEMTMGAPAGTAPIRAPAFLRRRRPADRLAYQNLSPDFKIRAPCDSNGLSGNVPPWTNRRAWICSVSSTRSDLSGHFRRGECLALRTRLHTRSRRP